MAVKSCWLAIAHTNLKPYEFELLSNTYGVSQDAYYVLLEHNNEVLLWEHPTVDVGTYFMNRSQIKDFIGILSICGDLEADQYLFNLLKEMNDR